MPLLADLDRITGELLRTGSPTSATSTPGPATCCTSTSRSSAASPTAAAGAWTANAPSTTTAASSEPVGFDCIHVAIDDYSRVVYAEILPDEKVATCAAFLHRAVQWFHDQHGVTVRRVLTDNAMSYRRGNAWAAVCSALQVKRRFIKPFCPWTNGKAERFNRTLLTDWAYARPWTSNAAAHRRL